MPLGFSPSGDWIITNEPSGFCNYIFFDSACNLSRWMINRKPIIIAEKEKQRMEITGVKTAFFSPTGNTKFAVGKIGEMLAERLKVSFESYDFTLPEKREKVLRYRERELAVIGVPVYAGRVPNKILPYIQRGLEGNGALAVPVVTFGNRNYDDALLELRNELENGGFHTVAAAAFAAEHAFCAKLAAGRPDEEDKVLIEKFAAATADKIIHMSEIPARISMGDERPVGNYYTPLGMDGKPAVFLKAKPETKESCTDCKLCAEACPMGSISFENPAVITGVCIKCQACVKICPLHAKYFDDPAYLSHAAMLEHSYSARAENEIFI